MNDMVEKEAPDGWDDFLSENGQKLWERLKALLGPRIRPAELEPYLSVLSMRSGSIESGQLRISNLQNDLKVSTVSIFATCDFFSKKYYGFCTGFDGLRAAIQVLRNNAKDINLFYSGDQR
jgi:hypothetical protein